MTSLPVSRIAIAICALMLVGGTVALVGIWRAYFTDAVLQLTGPRAEATVLKKEYLRDVQGASDYIVRYEFRTATGQAVVAQRNAPRQKWSELKVGSALVVVYDASDPNRSFIEGGGVTGFWAPILGTGVFGALAALGGLLLYRIYFPGAAGTRDRV